MASRFKEMFRIGAKRNPPSRNQSLDTAGSSMPIETDASGTVGEASMGSVADFADCPFLGHRYYEPIRELYRQSFGYVYLARHKETGQEVVIKLLERGPSVTTHVEQELLIHRKCTGHPNIIQLYEVFITQHYLAIVLEYASGGDLLDYVNAKGGLSEDEARWFFQQLVLGISYFHSIGVENREIKLDNKLLTGDPSRPLVKVIDFTYSKSEQINSDPNSALGSLPYTAPEVLSNSMKHGRHADVWSLGVALYKLVTGYYPFERPEDGRDQRSAVQSILSRIARVDYAIPPEFEKSPELRDLVCRMLVKEPERRISTQQIISHPWFQKNLPSGFMETNQKVNPGLHQQSEADICAVVREAQLSTRHLDPENIDVITDDVLNEEEVDDILEELSLTSDGDYNSGRYNSTDIKYGRGYAL
ncbi:hypothetical protein N2152v2_002289 [Parachlorella kessleri]